MHRGTITPGCDAHGCQRGCFNLEDAKAGIDLPDGDGPADADELLELVFAQLIQAEARRDGQRQLYRFADFILDGAHGVQSGKKER